MSGCTFVSTVSVGSVPISSGKTYSSTEQVYQCDSVQEAIKFVSKAELKIDKCNVFAFGELHPQRENLAQTTLNLYADTILPISSKYDVSELFYSDKATDEMLNKPLKSGRLLGAIAKHHFFPPDNYNAQGLKQLLQKAATHRVSLYGGGPKKQDPEAKFYGPNCPQSQRDRLAKKITQRMQEKISWLCQQSPVKRVDAYVGSWRNDVFDPKPEISFASYFRGNEKYNYIEIDLVSPEKMQQWQHLYLNEFSRWLASAVPEKGAMLISRGLSSYAIIVPRGLLDLQP